jgi:hypothetical protein
MKLENVIDSEHLLAVFSGKDIEFPWRFQPFFRIKIPFGEYVQFVRFILSTNIRPLVFESKYYMDSLSLYDIGDERGMLKLYYTDMAQAVLNEFNLSVKYQEEATVMCTYFEECGNVIELSDIDEAFRFTLKKDLQLVQGFISDRLNVPLGRCVLSTHNNNILKCALAYRAISLLDNPVKINIS